VRGPIVWLEPGCGRYQLG